MTMKIDNGEFYLATVNETQTAHNDKTNAIDAVSDDIDAIENDNASVVHVDTTGDGWDITRYPARSIYHAILTEEDGE